MTSEQQIPGGGLSVPNILLMTKNGDMTNSASSDDLNIELGSPLAIELGIPASIKAFVEGDDCELANTPSSQSTENSSPKKKKKGNKKKKKKVRVT